MDTVAFVQTGRKPETPVAVIENGTLKNQRVFFGTLKDIADIVERENVNGPTLIVIGEVVKIAVNSKTSSSL